ncbi:unnamed protein product [Rhizophagus irregularis]|nr:unnamed protein product [Rhizophagus irregularis]
MEKNDLSNWIQNTNNNLEIIEFDNIIPLYKILKVEQQRKIDDILKNDFKIIMTGITDLKDLDSNNIVHYKRINLNSESVLESEDYEILCNNQTLKETSVDITRCSILWMIVGNPSKFPVLSLNNQEFQVDCVKESITIQPDKSNYYIKTPFPLSQGYTISVHAYYSSTNYEPVNIIKLVGWDNESINVHIYHSKSNPLTNIEIDLHICILSTLSTKNKSLKIDGRERDYSLGLIGYILTKENLNKKLEKEVTQPKIRRSYSTLEDMPQFDDPPVPILKREGFGKEGRPIKVKANSFETMERIFGAEFLKNFVSKMRIGFKAYDGGSALYTTDYLGFDELDFSNPTVKEVEIKIKDIQNLDDGDSTRYKVKINRLDTVIELTQLVKYIKGEEFEWNFFSDEAFNVLNALIHKVGTESESYIQFGKSSIYDKGNKKIIIGGVEFWTGWFSTVRPGQGSLFINVNPTITTFYQPLNLDDFLVQFLYPKFRNLPSDFDFFQLEMINEVLRGLLVRPLHVQTESREPVQTERRIKKLLTTKQVASFKYKPRADSSETFPLEEYFKNKIEVYFKDKDQLRKPTKLFVEIMSDDGTKIAWPIKFCKIIEGQRYNNKKLTGRQRGEITLMRPHVNEKETIKGATEILQQQNDPTGIGMKVEPNLTKMDARILAPIKVKYAGSIIKPKNGQWNLKDVKFVESGERLEFWHVVIFEQNNWMPKREAINFIKNLARQCELQGMKIAKVTENMPAIHYLQYRGPDSVKQAYIDAEKRLNKPPQMILFIIPGEKSTINTELYEIIKRVMDTDIGFLSQCVSVDSKRNFRNPQYCANLAMKMNIKLGGVNSILPEDKLRLPNGEEVLFLGASTTHPKDKYGSSICAVAGSLDNQAGRFVTEYQDQERSGKEVILKMDKMIKKILKEYYDYQRGKRNIKKGETLLLPPCIIMYRNGVGESQYERLLRFELPKIKEACAEFRQADRNGNCLVGTVVDKKITHPTLNDFYLQSHYANQGTARPSHYTILYDDIKLTIDQFQSLSNALCYNFQPTSSSISIPTPLKYARLTCTRAKMYLTTSEGTTRLPKVHENLKNYPMYFI